MTTLWNECRLYKRIHNTGIWTGCVCVLYTTEYTPHSLAHTQAHEDTRTQARTHNVPWAHTEKWAHPMFYQCAHIRVRVCVCMRARGRAHFVRLFMFVWIFYSYMPVDVCVCKCACVCNSDSVYRLYVCMCLFMSIHLFSSWWSSTLTDGIRTCCISMGVHVNFECSELRLPVLLFYIFYFSIQTSKYSVILCTHT